MKILYVTRESQLDKTGGIATYQSYMAAAMRSIGVSVYLLTFGADEGMVDAHGEYDGAYVLPERGLRTQVAGGRQKFSHYTELRISELVAQWGIDVIESPDYMGMCASSFERMQAHGEKTLLATYNHGTIDEFLRFDRFAAPAAEQVDLAIERQQIRASDVLISPSRYALDRLASYGALAPRSAVIREPYSFSATEVRDAPDAFQINYHGRVSLSKGMTRLAVIANALHRVHELEKITLAGTIVDTTYDVTNIRRLILERLDPTLAGRVEFLGRRSREDALASLTPMGYAPHLGRADTFSYAAVEALDAGLLPIVMTDTAMAEFYPDDLRQHVIQPRGATAASVVDALENLVASKRSVIEQLQEYNRAELDPVRIASQTAALYEEELARKASSASTAVPGKPTGKVTVLIPTRHPDHRVLEAVESVLGQTVLPDSVLIGHDGSDSRDVVAEAQKLVRQKGIEVRVIDQVRSGLVAARALLAAEAATEWCVFLDEDDLLHPAYLESVLAVAARDASLDAVLTGRQNFGADDEVVVRNLLADHVHQIHNDFRMTALLRLSVVTAVGFDMLETDDLDDAWVFWRRFHESDHRARFLPHPLFFERTSGDTRISEGEQIASAVAITDLAAVDPPTAHVLRGLMAMPRAVNRS